MIIHRLNRFVIGTTRGRKMVKGIRLKGAHYEEYKYEISKMQRYPVEEWEVGGKCLWFMGIPIYRSDKK